MTGVEILNETQVVAESTFGWTAFWIVFSILLGIFIIIGIILSITEGPELAAWMMVIGAGIALGLTFGFISGIWCETPTKYEIIDTEGKILIVRERD